MEVKNIIFTGDSFTWGEALELEDEKFRELIKPKVIEHGEGYGYNIFHELQDSGYVQHIRNKLKFPTIVSEYFNSINISPKRNGGDNINAIQFAKGVLTDWNYLDFSHVIMNLTYEYRSTLSLQMASWFDKEYAYKPNSFSEVENIVKFWAVYESFDDYNLSTGDTKVIDKLKQFYGEIKQEELPPFHILEKIIKKQNEDGKFDRYTQFEYKVIKQYYIELKRHIEIVESKGVRVYLLNGWAYTTVLFFKKCDDMELKEFYQKRFIQLYSEEDNKTYKNLNEVMDVEKYSIEKKYPWSKNGHPSKEAHELIAKSIIKKLEKNLL